MNKRQLRQQYQQKRMALTVAQINKLDDLLLIQFQQLRLPPVNNLFTYIAIDEKNETGTDLIVDYLLFKNPEMNVAYPVTEFVNNTMQAALVAEGTEFVLNKYGIPEPQSEEIMAPEKIDVVLVPLLSFDEKGYRVGYGKGFYDRYLQQPHVSAIKIGLSYFPPAGIIADTHEFDVPLNYCVTPEKIYAF